MSQQGEQLKEPVTINTLNQISDPNPLRDSEEYNRLLRTYIRGIHDHFVSVMTSSYDEPVVVEEVD